MLEIKPVGIQQILIPKNNYAIKDKLMVNFGNEAALTDSKKKALIIYMSQDALFRLVKEF